MVHMRVEMINSAYIVIKHVKLVQTKRIIVHHVQQIKIESLQQAIFVFVKMAIMKIQLL